MQGGSNAGGEAVVSQFAGRQASFGIVPATPTRAGTADPIRIGMINQENTPIGSFPELRLGAEAAVRFINEELGGVDGRPLELVPCITTFSVEKSQACAQELVQKQVIAVTGGIDITSSGSIPILEQNGMPYIGGIPVNFNEMQSPISFQFSGGAPGAFVAFAWHAANELGAERVVVTYGDYPPIKAAAQMGIDTLKRLGVDEVIEIPFPVTTSAANDFLPIMTKAAESKPDAIFVGGADTACGPAMSTAHQLGVRAKLYLVGACAAPSIAEQIGADAVAGRIFNIENPTDPDDVDNQMYFAAVAKHGDPKLPAASAATISFRSVMNIWMLLQELGPDATTADLLHLIRQAKDRPSFAGHPYTCDGTPIPELPALCAPQEILVERRGDTVAPVTGWIDVPAVLRGELAVDHQSDGP